MITLKRIFAISTFALVSFTTPSAHAQLPTCQSTSSDSDGDGFGWENNTSCVVGAASTSSTGSTSSTLPGCQSASSDSDGDGFGWENGGSCLVGGSNTASSGSSSSSSGGTRPSCVSASSDPDGDGFGWENGDTCVVTASTGSGIISDDDGSATSNGITDVSAGGGSTGGSTSNAGEFSSGSGGGAVIRTTSLPTVDARSVTTNSIGGDRFATEQVGDFQLMQNAWRAWRAAEGHPWSQTIYTNNNGAAIGWSYDWGPGVPGASGRASDDFYVRSYPELIFGIKDEFRTSAPKSVIGFPVRVDEMPTVQIDYSFSAPQYGDARTVVASVTNRFPNGTTIAGERNVAAESFFYESVNGVCDDTLPVNRNGGSNHTYEVMVWLDSGAERLPAAARDFVTTVTLRGASYRVYTKASDSRYIAFVADNPQTSGRIYWNDFVDWARLNAHRVEEQFGANSNSIQIQDSWCVANILVGTEIFWGAGNFDLFEWTITQRQ